MIRLKHIDAFRYFIEKVRNGKINWALTGSYRLYLEDSRLFKPNDIDILTDDMGAKFIELHFPAFTSNLDFPAFNCTSPLVF